MVLVAKAHVGSNPTYHPNILKDIPVYEPGEVIQTMTLAAALSDGVIKSADEKMPTNHGRLASGRFPIDGYILNYEKRNQSSLLYRGREESHFV